MQWLFKIDLDHSLLEIYVKNLTYKINHNTQKSQVQGNTVYNDDQVEALNVCMPYLLQKYMP